MFCVRVSTSSAKTNWYHLTVRFIVWLFLLWSTEINREAGGVKRRRQKTSSLLRSWRWKKKLIEAAGWTRLCCLNGLADEAKEISWLIHECCRVTSHFSSSSSTRVKDAKVIKCDPWKERIMKYDFPFLLWILHVLRDVHVVLYGRFMVFK